MSDDQNPEAKDLGQAILLLGILGGNVRTLTSEVKALGRDMATRQELYQVRDDLNGRMDALREEVHRQSPGTTFERFLTLASKVLTFILLIASVGAMVATIVHFTDRVSLPVSKP